MKPSTKVKTLSEPALAMPQQLQFQLWEAFQSGGIVDCRGEHVRVIDWQEGDIDGVFMLNIKVLVLDA